MQPGRPALDARDGLEMNRRVETPRPYRTVNGPTAVKRVQSP